jgi:hypothetical protein
MRRHRYNGEQLPMRRPQFRWMMFAAVTIVLIGCAPRAEDIRVSPEDTWTFQVGRDYRSFAHCLADSINGAAEHSWFYQAPRPITTFKEDWEGHRITMTSVDPWGVEQVHVQAIGVSPTATRVVARAKNLERLGGGTPLVYVKGYVGVCAPYSQNLVPSAKP